MGDDKKLQKLELISEDTRQINIEKLLELFPQCAAESGGNSGIKAIDFDKLKSILSDNITDTKERYDFTWVGKRAAHREAYTVTDKTLRPCIEDSKNWDTTENLYIEGDNLQVLKLLKKHYTKKIKMIYIDPPYNTGKDFIYKDNFNMEKEEYDSLSGKIDHDGNRMFANKKEYGRYHSAWCSMIYARLEVARSLLTDDGVIFISIDDNEVANLRKICDEVFGEGNFIANIIWERAFAPINLMKHFSTSHDYIICYSKSINNSTCNGIQRSDEANDRYQNPDNDPRGVWTSDNMSVGPAVQSNIYPITTPSGRIVEPPAGRSWSLSAKAFAERLQDNRIWFGADGNGVPRIKRFLSELRKTGITPMSIWKYSEVGHSQDATKSLMSLFNGSKFFDYPKSVELIKRCCELYSDENSLILDFFSGSATTAHAVMQLNADDGGNRKFIMVQVPELTDENSEAYKAGYKNICEIGKERIRRAGEKIKKDSPLTTQNLDTGFRVFKLDSSNRHHIDEFPSKTFQQSIDKFVSDFKDDRDNLDLFFGCILDWGLPLNLPYKVDHIDGYTVYNYNDGDLLGCFDENINNQILEKIAKRNPRRIVFVERNFKNDTDKDNSDSKKGNLLECFKIWLNKPEDEVIEMVRVL